MEKTLRDINEAALVYWNMNNDLLLLVGGLAFIVLIIGFTLHKGKKVPGEEERMSKKAEYLLSKRARRVKQKAWLSDGITDLLLKGYTSGILDEQEYELFHLRFGRRMALPDMMPRKLTRSETKAAIKKRRSSGFYQKIVPVPKPKEEKKKNVIDQILAA